MKETYQMDIEYPQFLDQKEMEILYRKTVQGQKTTFVSEEMNLPEVTVRNNLKTALFKMATFQMVGDMVKCRYCECSISRDKVSSHALTKKHLNSVGRSLSSWVFSKMGGTDVPTYDRNEFGKGVDLDALFVE